MPQTCLYCKKHDIRRYLTLKGWISFTELMNCPIGPDIKEFDFQKGLSDDDKERLRFAVNTQRWNTLTSKELNENRVVAEWTIPFCDKCFRENLMRLLKVLTLEI